MSYMKTTTCRECEGKISLEGLCNEHERQLEQKTCGVIICIE